MAFISTPVTVSRGSVSRVALKSGNLSWKASVSRRTQARLPEIEPASRSLEQHVFRMQVEVGSEIPTFSLPTNGGGTMTNEDLSKGTYILYFYPRDNTPGCTVEAKDFKDYMVSLEPFNVKVVGASRDSVESHDQFVADYGLTFPLISDDGTLSEAFGVSKGDYSSRSTFIIEDGKVTKEWREVKSAGHVGDVVAAIKMMWKGRI